MNTAKSTAMQCINDKCNEGKTIADNAINNIRTAIQDVSNGAQLIAECRQFTITFPSVAGFVAKVTCLSQVWMKFTFVFSINNFATLLNVFNIRTPYYGTFIVIHAFWFQIIQIFYLYFDLKSNFLDSRDFSRRYLIWKVAPFYCRSTWLDVSWKQTQQLPLYNRILLSVI